jgi:23S rRNA (cytidine1920-2'-O)/16S rRNA (cytidine1409-2'-O)-methyltransferase
VESLPEPVSLVVVDASFISLKILLPVIKRWFNHFSLSMAPMEDGKWKGENVIALIKPQFEAGKKDVSRGDGVIRDPEIHRQVLVDVLTYAQQAGFAIQGLIRSPLLGPKGNVEFLVWLNLKESAKASEEIVPMVESALKM